MPPRKPSTVDSVNSVVDSVRAQREKDLQGLEASVQNTRQWLAATFESYKRQILESSGRAAVAAPAAATDHSTKSPATKKLKSEHNPQSLIPQHVVDHVHRLKVKQLQYRLRKLGLEVTGLKKVLQQRLLGALEEEYRNKQAKTASSGSSTSQENDEKHVHKEMEKLSVVETAKSAPATNEEAKKISEAPAGEQRPRVMSVEMVDASGSLECQEDDAMDVEKVEEPSVEATAAKDECVRQVSDDGAAQEQPSRDDKQSAIMEVEYAKKRSVSPKQSRSPLKMVQSSVKAAIRKFSKSPKVSVDPKDSMEAFAKKRSLMEIEPKILEKDHSIKKEDKKMEQKAMPPPAKSSKSLQKSTVRLISTPAITSSASSSLSSTKSGGSVLKSKSGKARNEARKAKLAEIRSKSKPVASAKPLTTPSLSSLKTTSGSQMNSKRKLLAAQMREKAAAASDRKPAPTVWKSAETPSTTAPASKSSESAKSLTKTIAAAADLGVKASAAVKAVEEMPATTAPVASKSSESSHSSAKAASSKTKMTRPSDKSKTPASAKSDRSEVLSPMDTYEMSESESSDSDSDSDDGIRKPKKRIPVWAEKVNLVPALERQYTGGKHKNDPDEIFGEVQTCDLRAIFDQNKSRYQRRTSSGNWTQDRATVAEKLTYKRTMGYAQKA